MLLFYMGGLFWTLAAGWMGCVHLRYVVLSQHWWGCLHRGKSLSGSPTCSRCSSSSGLLRAFSSQMSVRGKHRWAESVGVTISGHRSQSYVLLKSIHQHCHTKTTISLQCVLMKQFWEFIFLLICYVSAVWSQTRSPIASFLFWTFQASCMASKVMMGSLFTQSIKTLCVKAPVCDTTALF